jgi:hypothetical protein
MLDAKQKSSCHAWHALTSWTEIVEMMDSEFQPKKRGPCMYTYDIPLTVTAFEAGLRRL